MPAVFNAVLDIEYLLDLPILDDFCCRLRMNAVTIQTNSLQNCLPKYVRSMWYGPNRDND